MGGGTLLAGLAGCLGGSDDTDDDDDSADQEGDTDTETGEEEDELPADDALETLDGFLDAWRRGDLEEYNAFLHSGGPIDPVTEEEGFLMPQIEIDERQIDRHEGDEIVVSFLLSFEIGDLSGQRGWEVELRGEDGEWRVWELRTDVGFDEPAQHPTVAVQEFIDHLDAGDADGAIDMLHDDADFEEFIQDNIDIFEAANMLVENDVVVERQPGLARVAANIKDGEDSVPEEWGFLLVAEDRTWKLQRLER